MGKLSYHIEKLTDINGAIDSIFLKDNVLRSEFDNIIFDSTDYIHNFDEFLFIVILSGDQHVSSMFIGFGQDDDYARYAEIMSLSRSELCVGPPDYILVYFMFKALLKCGVRQAYVNLTRSKIRILRMIGITLAIAENMAAGNGDVQRLKIHTDNRAFHTYYRQIPSRIATTLRLLEKASDRKMKFDQIFDRASGNALMDARK